MLRFCSDFVFLPAVFCTCTCGCTPELLVLNSLLETVFLSNSSCILVQSIKISKKLMAAAMVQTKPLQGSKARRGQRGRGGRAPSPRIKYPANHVLHMPWPGHLPCQRGARGLAVNSPGSCRHRTGAHLSHILFF